MRTDLNLVPIEHPDEKQALTDLFTQLESQTDALGVTSQEIDDARAEVVADMGW